MITDYSSIFADFLLLDRPIIFSNFDHENYINKERALYWNYEEVTPGHKASDWNSIISALNEILVKNEDRYKNARSAMLKKIYSQQIQIEEVLDNVTHLVSKH